jgi:hypothetical protein
MAIEQPFRMALDSTPTTRGSAEIPAAVPGSTAKKKPKDALETTENILDVIARADSAGNKDGKTSFAEVTLYKKELAKQLAALDPAGADFQALQQRDQSAFFVANMFPLLDADSYQFDPQDPRSIPMLDAQDIRAVEKRDGANGSVSSLDLLLGPVSSLETTFSGFIPEEFQTLPTLTP